MHWLTAWNGLLWQWILPVLLTGTAIVCGIRQRGRPVRGFSGVLRRTYGSLLSRRADRQQRRVFASALAATMGTGNLVGTALAVMTGGAGARFWMWVSALLGMLLVYAENRLAARYRRDGFGGTAAYLRFGLNSRFLTVFFSFCCMLAALGMGDLAQSSTVAQTAHSFGIPLPAAGCVTAALLLLILSGGGKRIGGVAAWLMPLLCGGYLLGCFWLIGMHLRALPGALMQILRGAFGIRAAGAGISAAAFLCSMRTGICRGMFSHEAGLGSSAMLHMDAENAAEQGEWAAAEVFADTLVSCTATALVILTAPRSGAQDAAGLLLDVFSAGLGQYARVFLGICMMLLAFATMLGWYRCGEGCACALFGTRAAPVFRAAYLLAAFAGALGEPAWIWTFCDCMNGMTALPNLYALLRLHSVPAETQPHSESDQL
ncbi:MAG: sodium:alanine symporter family protein [Oscillospiraceae bacterium]|nr:sodium:alanine symporter family protein [Oscillospiraceae bacterium]